MAVPRCRNVMSHHTCMCPLQIDVRAAEAILNQFNNSGYPWFRLHPKGRGVIVIRPEGVPPFTFVEEYLGEVHTGQSWFVHSAGKTCYDCEDDSSWRTD